MLNTIPEIRDYFKMELAAQNFVTDKTGCKMIELRGASFVADEPAIFGTPNKDYIDREIQWYETMSRNINDIPGGAPTQWTKTADSEGNVNSNYGFLVYSGENSMQYEHVLEELRKNPESRRAVMVYTRPEIWYDYNYDGMNDFICTNVVQYFIRDEKLEAVVQMRSNDVVFGYKNDYAWQKYVLDNLVLDLNQQAGQNDAWYPLTAGKITWQVGSLHVYERHFHLVV